ncbi:MAG: DUF2207 domain-containing protein [Candidatus Micrarchaeia archaeon]
MKRIAIFLLLCAAVVFPFSIDSYYNHAEIMPDGSVRVHEDINFTLEKQYNEGFRSIRPADFDDLSDIVLTGVKVDGKASESFTQMNGDDAEIVWKDTHEGVNEVELDYILKDRAEVWDDYGRVCYEHFGANWPVPAAAFRSRMDLPQESLGRTVHFEIYSEKKGTAELDNLSVHVSIDDVPPGNFVGGCYLFPKDAVNSTKRMDGSALDILQDERKAYGSASILTPELPTPFFFCCIPGTALLMIAAAAALTQGHGRKRMPENILPPSEEDPAVVAAIVRNDFPEKDVAAATILDLINRGVMDIVELEKKGEDSATVQRQRTILMLRKTTGIKPHEKALIDMIFDGQKEVELDERAKKLDAIGSQSEAQKTSVSKNMESFLLGAKAKATAKGGWLDDPAGNRAGLAVFFAMFAFFIGIFSFVWSISEYDNYAYYGQLWMLWAIIGSIPVGGLAYLALAYSYATPKPLKGREEEFERWDAFSRAVGSSRLKEYPPASVAIWGRILVYATVLGMADKVRNHLSELDSFSLRRIESMDAVRRSSYVFYASSVAANNLASSGNRSGYTGSSSGSSGGWSSGGGGGFSSGSSGGGGFR